MRFPSKYSSCAAAIAAAVLATTPLSAQLPSPSARALGMGDNFTALARGFSAVSWNPAGLGMPGNSGFSLALLPIRGVGGLDPVTTSDLKEYEGELVPAEVRRSWLEEIRTEGSQEGNGGGDLTILALNVGRFGVHVGTSARGKMSISPDAAELLLFGNAGLTGEPHAFSGRGSEMDAFAASTAGISYGHPLRIGSNPENHAAVGVTVKYTVGHYLLYGRDEGSTLNSDPLQGSVFFPVIHTDSASAGNSGSGLGLDLGFGWTNQRTTLGLAIQNVVNTFEWDETKLQWRPGRAFFSTDSTSTEFDAQPGASAPASLTEHVADQKFTPAVAIGAAYSVNPKLTVSGDIRQKLGEGMTVGPKMHAGAGVEYRVLSFLPIRVGAAAVTGGYQLAGGAGLEFGAFNLTAGAARRETDLGTDAIGMVTLSFGGGR